jgi:hypothetical protein
MQRKGAALGTVQAIGNPMFQIRDNMVHIVTNRAERRSLRITDELSTRPEQSVLNGGYYVGISECESLA